MQRRRHRSETVNTSFQSVKGSKPNCYGVWLGGPVLEAWEWKDIQVSAFYLISRMYFEYNKPLSIEKLSSPAVLEALPPKQPHRCPWLRLAKPQQDSKCVSTGFHSEPKLRDGEDASVELRIAVLVAMPSRKALRSRGYMNVGVAGVPCGAS